MRLALLGALLEAPRSKKAKLPAAPPPSTGPAKFLITRSEQVARVMKAEVAIRLIPGARLGTLPPEEQKDVEKEAQDLLAKGDLNRLGLHLESDGDMRISGYFGQFFTADYSEVYGWTPDENAEVRLVNEPRYTRIHKI